MEVRHGGKFNLSAAGTVTNPLAIQITPGVVTTTVPYTGYVFFTGTVSFFYQGGRVLLAQNMNGGQGILVDDQINVAITHPDGSSGSFSGGGGPLPNNCYTYPLIPPGKPTDITNQFAYGLNTITITLQDACGWVYSSSPIWLVSSYPQEQGFSPNECPFCGNSERLGYIGGPINTSSRNYNYEVADLSIPTAGQPLQFVRTYNSGALYAPEPAYAEPLGLGWTHNHDIRLLFSSSDLLGFQYPTGTIGLKAPHGSLLTFYPDGAGSYVAAPGVQATLTRSVSAPYTYTVTTANQTTYVFTTSTLGGKPTGRLLSQRDPAGQTLSYTYYVTGPLKMVSDSTGLRYFEFFYKINPTGQIYYLRQVQDPLGRHVDFNIPECFGPCRTNGITDTRGLTWTYQYGAGGNQFSLTAIIDPDGRTVERNEYDSTDGNFGKVVRQWNGANELVAQFATDFTAANIITLTDALSRTMVHNYSSGVWTGGTNAATRPITRSYDTNFRLSFVADPNGHGPQLTWSLDGNNLNQILDAGGYTTTMQYDGLNNPTLITDTRSFTTAYVYSGTFLTGMQDALGSTWIFTPTNDGRNLLAAELAPGGRLTEYQYDPFGQRTVMTDAMKNVTRYEYDPVGRLITTTDAIGRITVNAYDPADHLIAVTNNFTTTSAQQNLSNTWNLITRYGYDGFGRQIAVTDTLNHITRNYFDGAGRLISVTANFTTAGGVDPNVYNLKTWYGYDAVGNQVAVTDTLLHVTFTEFDNLNRPVTVTQNYTGDGSFNPARPDVNVKRITHYDPAGNVIEQIDPPNANGENRVTRNWYDSLNRVISTTTNFTTVPGADPNTYNLTTWYEYDPAGNQVAITDTLNHITRNYYDSTGRLIKMVANFTDTLGVSLATYNLTTTFGYDAVGNQIAVTDTLLHVTFTEFDNLNRPVTVTQNYKGNGFFDPSKPDENVKRITHYDPAGNVIEQIDPPNANGESRITRNWYDSLNRVISTTANFTTVPGADPNTYNLTTWYEYDPAGNQVAITDTQQHMTRNYYDPLGRLISTTVNYRLDVGPNYLNQYNLTTQYEYDAVGNRVAITDPLTSTIRYTYDKLNRVIATTNVSGTATTRYDAIGNRVAVTDALTHTTVYTYNAVGQLIAEGNPVAGNTTRYQYDALGRTIIVTDALTHPTRTFYDAAGRVVSTTNALTGTTVITYNALGQQVGFLNENGKASYTVYDGLGRTIVVTDATGGVTSFRYDAVGNRTVVTDASTRPMTSTYDVANRLIQVQDALGNTTRYGYDSLGNRVVMTDANGIATGYGYDAVSRLSVVTESMTSTLGLDPNQYNLLTRYGYDPIGNRMVMTNAREYTTTYRYDALSRLIAMNDPLTHTTRYQYDAVGNRIKVIDANNQTTVYTYDVLNRNTQIDYGASLVTFEYDLVGNRTAMTDSLGVTRYLYDALNRPISITDALTGTVQYRYDDAGNRIKTIYPDGKIVTSTFDAANRLTQTLSWDGQVTKYEFDKAGRLMTTTWPISNMQSINSYDKAGRLVNLTHQGPYWLLATYTYTLDAVGNRLAVQERVLPPTPFVYLPMIRKDDGGEQMMAPPGQVSPFDSPLAVPAPFQSPLPTPTTTGSAGIPTSPIADLTLLVMTPTVVAALVGRRRKGRKWTLPLAVLAGALITVGLTQTSGAAPAPMPFLSPTGNPPPGCTLPTAIGDTRVISYTYDPLSRLTNAAYSSGECYQYAYDKVGNRTALTTTIGTTNYQYDSANRLSSVNGQPYTWDNNGNLINDGSALYRYDQANRLISTTLNSTTSLFNYNGDGVRLKQVVAGAVTTYTQDLAALLPVVLQSRTGVTTTKYLYATGTRPLAQNSTVWGYLLPDALGSVRQIVSSSGYIIRTQDYEPYGSPLNGKGNASSMYGFTGEERDQSGLIFLRARYMQPRLGVFVSRDPWSGDVLRPGSMNGWNYTEGNPVNRADPLGLWQCGNDKACQGLQSLKPIIMEVAQRLNQPMFTNMTVNGFASMLAAKTLYEGKLNLPAFSLANQDIRGISEPLGDFLGSVWWWDISPWSPTSMGINNVYTAHGPDYVPGAFDALTWWEQFILHQDAYTRVPLLPLSLTREHLQTEYYNARDETATYFNNNPLRYESFTDPSIWSVGMSSPVLEPPRGVGFEYSKVAHELLTDKGAYEHEALLMLYQGWQAYEGIGDPICWGANKGLPTSQISAFRIAMGVLAGSINDKDWNPASPGPGMSIRWVKAIPTAADYLGLPVTDKLDYFSYNPAELIWLTTNSFQP
jgi:RHS repeat-associated protein